MRLLVPLWNNGRRDRSVVENRQEIDLGLERVARLLGDHDEGSEG